MPITCLRLFTVYGPRGRPDMAPYKFTELVYKGKELSVFGDGGSKRDYTYVSDVVDGISKALNKLREYRWSSHLDYLGEPNFPSITEREFLASTIGTSARYEKEIRNIISRSDIASDSFSIE